MDSSTLIFLAFLAAVVAPTLWVIAKGGVGNAVTDVADEIVFDVQYAEVDAAMADLLGTARRVQLRMVLPGTYTVTYKRTPGWAIVVAIFGFPVGLLALFLGTVRYQLVLSVTPEGGATRVRVVGRVHRKFAEAIGKALWARFAGSIASR
ncbi:hypothetical protein [Marmoricola sp. RAF53]|uniref:hypothetical protein n=1 Tax=Marmoricola sp. RAF53 TaxID=3233059 RepID=UPI003F9E59E1